MQFKRHTLLTLLLLAGLFFSAQAQTREKDDKEPSRIGWGVNIGNIRFYNQTFEFGLAPNVAYRISEPLAIGFMLKADFFSTRYYDNFDNRYKFSSLDLGPTIFTRLKPLWNWDGATPFLKGLFLMAEYEKAFLTRVDEEGTVTPGEPLPKLKIQQDYIYVGIGSSTGYPFSTNVSIHYNLLDDIDSVKFPFSYRLGFTWNY